MKYASIALVALAVASAGEARPQCAPVNNATVEKQFDRFNAAWATKDPDKVTALFASDAVLLPTLSGKERTTTAGIRDYFVGFLKKSPVGHIDSSTIRTACNKATRSGNWSVTLTDPATHKTSVAKARYSFVYRYQDGQWLISHLHSSLMPGGD